MSSKILHREVGAKVDFAGLLVLENFVALALGDDFAVVDDYRAVGDFQRVADVVVGDQDADAAFF